jgi:hypothetical protein
MILNIYLILFQGKFPMHFVEQFNIQYKFSFSGAFYLLFKSEYRSIKSFIDAV